MRAAKSYLLNSPFTVIIETVRGLFVMKKLVVGILAHVDAGKTTLAESLLYLSGRIRKPGRVDKKDAYLDNHELERARGITIFSKQAVLTAGGMEIYLLDTPGHVDFSAEMERTLAVLDYALLVINGADGVQGHTKTIWQLLAAYRLPVFLFINKMDQEGSDKEKLLAVLKQQLDDCCIEFGQSDLANFLEQVAMCDDELLESYLKTGQIADSEIKGAIQKRKLFPCYFGSALKLEGVENFLQGIVKYAVPPSYGEKFGAKVFKISRDEQGERLTHLKITGGKLKVRDLLTNGVWEEKVNQIRIYSGRKFLVKSEVEAGTVCAVTGLAQAKAGEGLGEEEKTHAPVLEPVLSYQIILPAGCDSRTVIPKLLLLAEEEPELQVVWDEELNEIRVQVMGEVQTEILQSLLKSSFGLDVSFGFGKIVYKETIAGAVEGVGHFEMPGHYAEVRLLMEPGRRGSGLVFADACSEELLAKNWKKCVMTYLQEKTHRGVLTGAAITDMKITLVSGRAYKYSNSGDFREAAYRAVRQGLMEAGTVLLEPYYSFQLELPQNLAGRAMADIERMHGSCRIARIQNEMAVVAGRAPVALLRSYWQDVQNYTGGSGKLFFQVTEYGPCHNAEEVLQAAGYDAARDIKNPADSVFCKNGEIFTVSWDEVKDHMHVERFLQEKTDPAQGRAKISIPDRERQWIEPEEIDRIFTRTYFANRKEKAAGQKWKYTVVEQNMLPRESKQKESKEEEREECLLVDGYNIIFAWPELKALAEDSMDAARLKLLDTLVKYQAVKKCRIIAVFDAYRVPGHTEEVIDYDGVLVVFTREAQTADQFIEKFSRDNRKKLKITVATSDFLQQIIIRGAGCSVLSARELKEEIERTSGEIMRAYREGQLQSRRLDIESTLSAKNKRQIEELLKEAEDM